MRKHPGFNAVARHVAASGRYSLKTAAKIVAAAARHSSLKAKRKNPRLRRVKGK